MMFLRVLLVLVFQYICIGFWIHMYLYFQYICIVFINTCVLYCKKNNMEKMKMAYQKKQNDTIYNGRDVWVNQRTGEIIEADQVIKKVPRNGFEITYLSYFIDLFDKLGGKKYVVFKYILSNKNSENALIITNRELAKVCNVGINTVTDTLKLLKEAGLITQKTGAIMLHPKLAHKGKKDKELYLLQKFVTFGEMESETNNE